MQEPSYRAAAALISRKLRARKRTPVQEAAGVPATLLSIHKQIASEIGGYMPGT